MLLRFLGIGEQGGLTRPLTELVEVINGGNQTVPTVLYPDGSSATNPSLADVKKALG